MPDRPKGHPEFLAAWIAATGATKPLDRRPTAGTVGALVVAFLASAAYQNLAPSTRGYMRRGLEHIRLVWGEGRANTLDTRVIMADLSKLKPHPANNRLRAWKALCRWGFQEAALLEFDPAAPIVKRVGAKSTGHTPWTREDVAAFRDRWPHDTPQRMAFELIHRTAASIVDACNVGPGMVRDGWLRYTRQKSGSAAVCPMTAATSPAWFEHDDHLAMCVSAQPRHMTYLVTADGAPRSVKAASQWFAAACREAGLKGKTAHGLRKHRAAVFQENGAAADKRMAILGHETASEARRYSASADLVKTVSGTDISNSFPTQESKSLN
jgi:integrase